MKSEESVILNVSRLMLFAAKHPTAAEIASMEPASVSDVVIEAVERTSAERTLKVIVPAEIEQSEGLPLLHLMAYSYAKGVFASEEIERKSNAAVGRFTFDAHALRRFRRLNRSLLQSVLERTLRLIRKRKTQSCVPPPGSPLASTMMVEPVSTIAVSREAAARLDQATFIDGMSLE